MRMFKQKYLRFAILVLLVLMAFGVRVYKLNSVPPSLSWDEASVGYNAYSIVNSLKDEWGNLLPFSFTSFEDFKHPIHIYITGFFVALMGLTDMAVRFPSALFGVLNVVLLYVLVYEISKRFDLAIASAFILAFSPYNIQFSRFNHELNFVIFFFMLGVYFFYRGLEKKNYKLSLSFLFFGISLITYHSAKVVLPILIFFLVALHIRKLMKVKKCFFAGILILGVFVLILVLNPDLLGIARARQTSFSSEEVEASGGKVLLIAKQYVSHYSYNYLFVSGDSNPRHSSQIVGEFYRYDLGFMVVGFLILFYRITRMRDKNAFLLLVWALLGPLPASLVNEAPHAARSAFVTGSWHVVSALGLVWIVALIKPKKFVIFAYIVVFGVYISQTGSFLIEYFAEYGRRHAIDWQFGMKEIVMEASSKDYDKVYVTDERQQPYIFFLYYLQFPQAEFQEKVVYNIENSRSYNLVASFGKYRFGLWDRVESYPVPGVLYVLTPSEYDGLRHKPFFEIKKLVKYPDGGDAFYLVSKRNE